MFDIVIIILCAILSLGLVNYFHVSVTTSNVQPLSTLWSGLPTTLIHYENGAFQKRFLGAVVLCCVVLFCFVLCCAVLCCVTLHCVMLRSVVVLCCIGYSRGRVWRSSLK